MPPRRRQTCLPKDRQQITELRNELICARKTGDQASTISLHTSEKSPPAFRRGAKNYWRRTILYLIVAVSFLSEGLTPEPRIRRALISTGLFMRVILFEAISKSTHSYDFDCTVHQLFPQSVRKHFDHFRIDILFTRENSIYQRLL